MEQVASQRRGPAKLSFSRVRRSFSSCHGPVGNFAAWEQPQLLSEDLSAGLVPQASQVDVCGKRVLGFNQSWSSGLARARFTRAEKA